MGENDSALEAALGKAKVTREVVLERGALSALPDVFARQFPGSTPLVIADDNTFAAAGSRAAGLLQAGDPLIFPASPRLKPRIEYAHRIRDALLAGEQVAVAVGSGVVNDLTKYGAALAGRPYMVTPTAASMDGYAASGAPLLEDGFKRTQACPPPVAIVADLDIIGSAPAEMSGWGYGDLAGKAVAGLDWLLAEALAEEPIDRESFDMVQGNLATWLAEPAGVAAGEPHAIAHLMAGLFVSGFAIQAHGNSRPASGSEHQFSHLWEMEGLQVDGVAAAHGACVAVGTLAMLAAYDWLLSQEIPDDAAERALAVRRDASAWRAFVEDSLASDGLRAAAWAEVEAKLVAPERLRARVEQLRAIWPGLRESLRARMVPPTVMRDWLQAAGAPSHFADLGFTANQFSTDYGRAQLIRRRFTALDVLVDLGWLDPMRAALFGPDGFWAESP